MKFYTNITRWGNQLLLREYVDGQRLNRRIKYSPTMYSIVTKPTEYRTLEGKFVTPIKHQTMSDANEWVDNYKNQPELIYGNTLYQYSYLAEQYPNRIEWDIEKLLMVTIDIETECENGFPNVEDAIEKLISITIKNHQSKEIIVWGVGRFVTNRDDVHYVKCDNEQHLIKQFLMFWERNQPDIITGWNTEFFDIPYLCNRIIKICGEDEIKRMSPGRSF